MWQKWVVAAPSNLCFQIFDLKNNLFVIFDYMPFFVWWLLHYPRHTIMQEYHKDVVNKETIE